MALERIDSIYDIPALETEQARVIDLFVNSKKSLLDLNNTIKNFKGVNFSNVNSESGNLSKQMNDAANATAKASKANLEYEKSLQLIQKTREAKARADLAELKVEEQVIKNIQLEDKVLQAEIKSQDALTKAVEKTNAAKDAAPQTGSTNIGVTTDKVPEINVDQPGPVDITFRTNATEIEKEISDTLNKTGSVISETEAEYSRLTNAMAANNEVQTKSSNIVKETVQNKQILVEAENKLNYALSEENTQLQGFNAQTSLANKAAKQEAQDALGITDAYTKLVRQQKEAQQAANAAAVEFGAESEQAKKLSAEAQELNVQLQKVRVQQIESNAAAKSQAIAALGLTDAYGKLVNEYNEAQRAAKNLAATPGADPGEIKRTAEVAETLFQKIKTIDASVGQFNRNVGNYSNSLKGAFSVLETELVKIRQQLQTATPNTEAFEKLEQQEQLLTKLTQSLNKNFSTAKQEMLAFSNAAKVLGSTFGQTSESFTSFVSHIGERKNELDDIQKTINFQSSDTKYIDGIASAVNGLVGVYGAAQSAAVLLGNDDKDLQKTMVKLQATLTLVTSVQQVLNSIQTESGAIQVALAAKTSLLSSAQKINAGIMSLFATTSQVATAALAEQAVTSEATTIAESEQAIATEALTVADTETVLSTEALTGAMAEQAVVTEGATAATATFATVLTATGILAAIAAIAAAAYYASKAYIEWATSTDFNVDKQNELADSLEKTNSLIIAQANAIGDANKADKEYAQNQLRFSSEATGNKIKEFELRKKINAIDKQTAQEQINFLGATNARQSELLSQLQSIDRKKEMALETLNNAILSGNDDQKEAATDLINFYDKQAGAIKPLYDAGEKARMDFFNANANANEIQLQQQKFYTDEERKLILSTVKSDIDLIKYKNDKVLSSEQSFFGNRLIALKSNLDAEKKLIEAARVNAVTATDATPGDINIANRQAADDKLKIETDTTEKIKAINDKYRADELSANEAESLATLKSIESYAQLQLDIEEKLKQAHINNIKDERQARESTSEDVVTRLAANYAKEQRVTLEALAANRKAHSSSFELGTLDETKYQEELLAIQEKYSGLSIDEQIKTAKEILKTLPVGLKDWENYNKKIEELELARIKLTEDAEKASQERRRKRLEDFLSSANDITAKFTEVIQTINDIGYEKQSANIENIRTELEKNSEQEIENINNSSLSEEDKQRKLQIAQATTQSKKEELDRRQRKLDSEKARFDRISNIANIITSTALAVVKALGVVPGGIALAILTGALGAAQLAKAIATPVPYYRTGRKGSKTSQGEYALTDEDGPEVYKEPGKPAYIGQDQPNIKYIKPGTEIISHEEAKQKNIISEADKYETNNSIEAEATGISNEKLTNNVINNTVDNSKIISSKDKELLSDKHTSEPGIISNKELPAGKILNEIKTESPIINNEKIISETDIAEHSNPILSSDSDSINEKIISEAESRIQSLSMLVNSFGELQYYDKQKEITKTGNLASDQSQIKQNETLSDNEKSESEKTSSKDIKLVQGKLTEKSSIYKTDKDAKSISDKLTEKSNSASDVKLNYLIIDKQPTLTLSDKIYNQRFIEPETIINNKSEAPKNSDSLVKWQTKQLLNGMKNNRSRGGKTTVVVNSKFGEYIDKQVRN